MYVFVTVPDMQIPLASEKAEATDISLFFFKEAAETTSLSNFT